MTGAEPPGRPPGNWVRFAGAGLELAAAIGGMCAIGYLLDRKLGTAPRCLLVCAILGIVGGLYNLIRPFMRDALGLPRRGGQGGGNRGGGGNRQDGGAAGKRPGRE